MRLIRATFGWPALLVLSLAIAEATTASAQSAPEPEDVLLTTKDGVQLKATFYPSDAGEQAIPIVLLHDKGESRAVFDGVARLLQSPVAPDGSPRDARAVLTVDLRGYGDSRTLVSPRGGAVELDASNFGQRDFQAMVLLDMEEVRKFLVEQNNARQLNLNKLCLIGTGMGANVATLWAARDWSMPPLARIKQGQDVKALVLISPRWGLRGLPLKDAIRFPAVQKRIAIFLAFGNEDAKFERDAKNIHKNLERFHPEPPRDQRLEKQTLFYVDNIDTSLQGTELLTKPQFELAPYVDFFIEQRLGRQEFPWLDRTIN